MKRLTSTDPGLIRDILAYADEHGPTRAAEKYDFHPATLSRWRRRARTEPGWPTDAHITEWRALAGKRKVDRERHAAWAREWRKAVYLQRGPMLIDGIGTTRRLQALAAIGWSSRDVGKILGVSPARVGHMRSGLWPKVNRRTAAAVARVYDELSMTVPQDPATLTRGRVRVHERTRAYARTVGWPTPLAWDDDRIDDPNAKPHGTAAFETPRTHAPDVESYGCPRCGVRRQVRYQDRGKPCRDCRNIVGKSA